MKHLRQCIRRLLREQIEIPPTLYHATYGPVADSIKRDGLGGDRDTVYEDSVRGTVYLALTPEIAFSYAETSDDATGITSKSVIMSANSSSVSFLLSGLIKYSVLVHW